MRRPRSCSAFLDPVQRLHDGALEYECGCCCCVEAAVVGFVDCVPAPVAGLVGE